MRTKRLIIGFGALALGASTLLGIPAAQAREGERIRQDLIPVADANARGQARLVLRTVAEGRFEVRAMGLAPDSTFEVLVNGVRVGTLETQGGGYGRARFRTTPHGRHDQLLGFDPRGQIVVIRSAAGEDVLSATVPVGTPAADGDVVCCVPDDDGAECEDRTADECAAAGGTVSTASSCLPNPCADAPPQTDNDVVCCIPDDSGPECEDRSASECAAQGGVVVEATSCVDNPCDATPGADPDIQCCVPDDSGSECEDRTPAECAARGGIDMGPGTCTPDPCAAAASPTPGTEPGDDGGSHGGGSGGGKSSGGGARPGYY